MSRIEVAVYLLASALGLAAVMRICSDAHLRPQIQPTTSTPPPPLATFQSPPIAGYVPGSRVAAQSAIDHYQKDIETALAASPADFTGASTWYAFLSDTEMYERCPACPYKHYMMFYDYYGSFTYTDDWVWAALTGTNMTFAGGKHGPNNFAVLGEAARIEAVKKGTAYLIVWMHVIRELEDAVDECTSCTSNCSEHSTTRFSVHSWDEGVAYYTGSLEGTAHGGDGAGKLLYRLAEERCANFGTCLASGTGATGTSQVNTELFQLFDNGRDWLQQGRCSSVRPLVNQIVSLMTVPLVQGALRSAYKNSQAGTDMATPKSAAEGATFSAAVLPLVHRCNAASAAVVSDNLKFGLFPSGGTADTSRYSDFAAVKSAFEDVYACLGITCAQVGGLIQATDAGVNTAAACTFQSPPIAGYVPGSHMAAQSGIDHTQKDIETALAASPADFTLAKTRYTVGGNSKTAANSTPAVSADDAAAFGLRLFEKLCDEDENTVVMSPLVIAGVLALAAAGATPGGKTEAQLLGALGVQTAADHPALAARVLAGNGATVRGGNAVFTRASIKPSFVSLVQSLHGSEAAPLGTSYAPVNAWVAEKTEGRIPELFQGSPSPDIVALLVSAVFFKGSWATPFSPAATQPASFVTLRGEGVAAQLMQQLGTMPASREVAALGGAAAVRLDYGDGGPDGEAPRDYCALFVLPRQAGAEGLAATVAAVARASLPEVLSKLRSQEVQLSLPRLRATYGISSVKTALRSLGVVEPFKRSGGFLALTDDPKVRIDDVVTKAAIELDEEGTVAVAVAGGIGGTTCVPPPPLKLAFDRPFVMAVLHVPTGYPLFLARVLEPGK